MTKTLYIIAGCNGAGKTTASYTVLPEIWKCKEFVNADEIAKGLSPFNPEGGHNIPRDTIIRRYHLGIENFFKLFMDKVDYWMLVDNVSSPRILVADSNGVYEESILNNIKAYVK